MLAHFALRRKPPRAAWRQVLSSPLGCLFVPRVTASFLWDAGRCDSLGGDPLTAVARMTLRDFGTLRLRDVASCDFHIPSADSLDRRALSVPSTAPSE